MPDTFVKDVVFALCGKMAEITFTSIDVRPENRFFVIPGKQGPRWIIPYKPSLGWPALRQWRPYDFASRAKWRAVAAAYRMGKLKHVPGIEMIGICGKSGTNHPSLSEFAPVVNIGTPGAARKIVATLVDRRSCKPVSLFKAPLGISAKKKILHEAEILKKLSQEKPGLAPGLVSVDERMGASYQKVISGKQAGRKLSPAIIDYLIGLKVSDQTISFAKFADDIKNEISTSENVTKKDREAVNRILEKLAVAPMLPAVWVHGDFAPWNMVISPSGQVTAVDWEEAVPNGLPLFDLVHFYTQQAFLFSETSLFPRQAHAFIRQYLERLAISEQYLQSLILVCLATDWVRSVERGNKERAVFFLSQLKTQGSAWQ